jgi:alginate O-acetyltransferase complex protein AlgI
LRFDDALFLFQFLPALLAVFFVVAGADAFVPVPARVLNAGAMAVLVAASAYVVAVVPFGWLLLVNAGVTFVAGALIDKIPAAARRRVAGRTLLGAAIAANAATLAYVRWHLDGPSFMFAGASILTCLAVAFVFDVYRGKATTAPPLESLLYLVQFPVIAAGPIVRAQEFSAHQLRLRQLVGLGAFTYGVRRVVIGLVKVMLVAGVLMKPVDAIFALPAARIGTGAAWLAAVAYSLQLYYQFSGFADIAIGLGRMLGLRYPENFRRPYLADSVREFWRRWHVSAITWLRDYLSLPMVGRDRPTPRLFANILVSFSLLALWHGGSGTALLWAGYSGGWLALEAIGLSLLIERAPRWVRHAYLLLVVVIGWVVLRAQTPEHAWLMLKAMAGWSGANAFPAGRFLSFEIWAALFVAVIGAGPLVPWISRWRVTLDATTAAVVMMLTAVSLWVWRGIAVITSPLKILRSRSTSDRNPSSSSL